MNDDAIIALYEARDEAALVQTQEKFGGYCYTIVYNILGNSQDAEECVNDMLIKLWNAIPPAKPDNLYAYVAATSRNLARNRWTGAHRQRRSSGEAEIALDELVSMPAASDEVERDVDGPALGDALNSFLGTISEEHRKIFVQRYWYFMPVEDIAEDLNITKSKVTVTLMRTRKKLQTYLEQEGYL